MLWTLQESTATLEPRWGRRRSSAAGRKASATSKTSLISWEKLERKENLGKIHTITNARVFFFSILVKSTYDIMPQEMQCLMMLTLTDVFHNVFVLRDELSGKEYQIWCCYSGVQLPYWAFSNICRLNFWHLVDRTWNATKEFWIQSNRDAGSHSELRMLSDVISWDRGGKNLMAISLFKSVIA